MMVELPWIACLSKWVLFNPFMVVKRRKTTIVHTHISLE